MQKNSNIRVISNIYPVKNSLKDDREFQKQVRGRNALIEMAHKLYGFRGAPPDMLYEKAKNLLTEMQKKQWDGDLGCSLNKGEYTFGPLLKDGVIIYGCRCTKIDCPLLFKECRPGLSEEDLPGSDDLPEITIVDRKDVPQLPELPVPRPLSGWPDTEGEAPELPLEEASAGPEFEEEEILDFDDEIIEEKNEEENTQEYVIYAEPEKRIMVNAGPGTGKTHSLIEKIKCLVTKYNLSPADNILVLCFSRAAVAEIKTRLQEALNKEAISGDIAFLEIRTFDSFATYLLRYLNEDIDLTGKGYDERIEMAIKEINEDPDILENLEHFIVDEIQDLVGVRARFVQKILENCIGGFTLLGDSLQAIYDYQVRDSKEELDSKKFNAWLQEYFINDLEIVEYHGNYRQTEGMAPFVDKVRKLVKELHKQPASNIADEIENNINTIKSCGKFYNLNNDVFKGKGSVCFLCRTNGEALKLSHYFRKNDIEHTIQKPARYRVLPKNVGMILGDLKEDNINYVQFYERCQQQLKGINSDNVKCLWYRMKYIENSNTGFLDVKKLREALITEYRVPDELFQEEQVNSTIISTIHRSKGREYDTVIFTPPKNLKDNEHINEEARVYYVAVSRAKKKVYTIKSDSYQTQKVPDGKNERWTGIIPFPNRRPGNLEIGLYGDIKETGFVDCNLLGDAGEVQRVQKYIKENIQPGDELRLFKLNGFEKNNGYYYGIFHDNQLIGAMSESFLWNLRNVFTHFYGRGYKKNRPDPQFYPDFDYVYVNRIISIVKRPETLGANIAQPYASSGIWNGIDLVGFAKCEWY